MSDFLWPHGLQHARIPCLSLLEFAEVHDHWVRDTVQPSHSRPLPTPFAFNISKHQGLFQWVSSSSQAAKVLELQHWSFQWIFRVDFLLDWLIWSCSPRKSQESSPEPQFETIYYLALSLLYGPTLTFIHDYWKNHRFDCMDLCEQSDVSAF